jgi:hypothetical protein
LPAIQGHIPHRMVRAIRAFLEFCYIARQNVLTEHDLAALDDALSRFHEDRTCFVSSGVRNNFLLPRQHSLDHYAALIRLFGAPNGLCSSITESKHIRAVKEPWRRSNRNEALGQILVTNQRLDQLAAARVDFAKRGMLDGTCLSYVLQQLGMYCSSSSSSENHFNTRNFILAAIHAPDPASVNEAEVISDANQPTQPISIEDEDPNEEVVNDLGVVQDQIALPLTVRKCNLFITFSSVAKCMP